MWWIILYGSALEAGLLSSKYPFQSCSTVYIGIRILAPLSLTPYENSVIFYTIVDKNLAKFYSRNLSTFNVSLNVYNKELKTKILNKIESHLWFKTDAS